MGIEGMSLFSCCAHGGIVWCHHQQDEGEGGYG